MIVENKKNDNLMEEIVSLSKRRGFVFQGSEIYGGLAGTWDYGPLGVSLKENIKKLWWKKFVSDRNDIYGLDCAILMNQEVWKASGHVAGFSDPLAECGKCKKRFKADILIDKGKCSDCDQELSEVKQFNMMFKTQVGSAEDESSISYLRPETAQGMFANFKNIVDSMHPKLPFGLAQIGKAFRNEIAPRDFLFRVREFEQMEIEYFIKESKWVESFEDWRKEMKDWMNLIGLDKSSIHERKVPDGERAHYSKKTIDFEYDFPFGRKELYGLAYRTDFDLRNHTLASGVDLSYFDEISKERFIPHCIEPTFGLDRTVLAVLISSFKSDSLGGEKRNYLKLPKALAPVKVAVFPLLKNKPELVTKARALYDYLKTGISEMIFDDNGNIGKRYRRQDEIGTPFCLTVDFDSLEKDDITIRDRDTGEQERVKISELKSVLDSRLR